MSKAKAKPSKIAAIWAEFWAGFTELAALSLWICGGVAVCVAAFTLYLFRPEAMSGTLGNYVPRSPADAHAFAMVQALRMAKTPPSAPTIVFLGSSAVAQMVGDGEAMREMLRTKGLSEWHIVQLTTPLQSPLDQIRLAQTALSGQSENSPPVIVVIGVGLTRLGWTDERLLRGEASHLVPLASTWSEAELQQIGAQPSVPQVWPWHFWPWHFWALENREFVALNGMVSLLRFAVQRPARQKVDIYADGAGPLPEMRSVVIRQVHKGAAEQAGYFSRLARFAAQLQALPHVSVVFMEEPLAPSLVAEGGLGAVMASFKVGLAQLGRETASDIWPVVSEANLSDALYYDDIHIRRGDAQQRVRLAMVEHIARLSRKLEASP